MNDKLVLENEISCVTRRASGMCKGGSDCVGCDLLMTDADILKTYYNAIENLNVIKRLEDEIVNYKALVFNKDKIIKGKSSEIEALREKLNKEEDRRKAQADRLRAEREEKYTQAEMLYILRGKILHEREEILDDILNKLASMYKIVGVDETEWCLKIKSVIDELKSEKEV